MRSLDIAGMIISPGSSHSFRINVVGYDVAVVRELALADCAYSVLFGNFPLRQFAHLGGRPQLPVSPWVVRVFDALHTPSLLLLCVRGRWFSGHSNNAIGGLDRIHCGGASWLAPPWAFRESRWFK
jgi:hypothetical protein